MDLTLRNNLAGTGFAHTLALTARFPPNDTKPVQFVDIYYSFTDTPEMTPLYLGRGNKGETFQNPFDPKGREVDFWFNPAPENTKPTFTDFAKMARTRFTPDVDTKPTFRFMALVSQTGTSAPTLDIIENTLGEVTTAYSTAGGYRLESDGLFSTQDKCWFTPPETFRWEDTRTFKLTYSDANAILLESEESGGGVDGLLSSFPILIEVKRD